MKFEYCHLTKRSMLFIRIWIFKCFQTLDALNSLPASFFSSFLFPAISDSFVVPLIQVLPRDQNL